MFEIKMPGVTSQNPHSPAPWLRAERASVKDQLESLVGMMVDRGILLEEAVTEFEKKFIKRVLDRLDGNQSRAAKALGIHRNTLSRKVGEYKLDRTRHKRD
jgi:Fis family transcriptional regulator, factor for inversion stimulation protein